MISKLFSLKRTYLTLVASLAVLCFASAPALADDVKPVEPPKEKLNLFAWPDEVTANTATFNFTVDRHVDSGLYLEIGKSLHLGHRKDASEGSYEQYVYEDEEDGTVYKWTNATATLKHLKPATTYYYRACLEFVGCGQTQAFYTSPD